MPHLGECKSLLHPGPNPVPYPIKNYALGIPCPIENFLNFDTLPHKFLKGHPVEWCILSHQVWEYPLRKILTTPGVNLSRKESEASPKGNVSLSHPLVF